MRRLAGVVLVMVGVAAAAFAADVAPPGSINPGTYVDLTWLRELKLSTAYFVNPGLASSSSVAYIYDPNTVATPKNKDELKRLLETGELAIAHSEGDGKKEIKYVIGRNPPSMNAEELLKFFKDDQSSKQWHLVGGKPNILGERPKRVVVNWGPEQSPSGNR